MLRVFVLHGPNLNLLGQREPEVYGSDTLDSIGAALDALAASLGATLSHRQSNHEGQLIDWPHEARAGADGVVLNPGGLTHTSVALRDAITACERPVVEVHISNVYARETFRKTSLVAPVCIGSVSGFGKVSYALGLRGLIDYLNRS